MQTISLNNTMNLNIGMLFPVSDSHDTFSVLAETSFPAFELAFEYAKKIGLIPQITIKLVHFLKL